MQKSLPFLKGDLEGFQNMYKSNGNSSDYSERGIHPNPPLLRREFEEKKRDFSIPGFWNITAD